MRLADLAEYAMRNYRIQEDFKWPEFPGFSVLSNTAAGTWTALLMRRKDPETGEISESCDMKCGQQVLTALKKSYLGPAVRMKGPKWINIVFDSRTEPELVKQLFDRAYASGDQRGYTMVLEERKPEDSAYTDTVLPFQNQSWKPGREAIPEKIAALRRMFHTIKGTSEERKKNFVKQAEFMADYEDDYPWSGGFEGYFPLYQHLNTAQLRGYFSWRTRVRKGEIQDIPRSVMHIYLFELINMAGVSSLEDCLKKLKEFEDLYLAAGLDQEDETSGFQNKLVVHHIRRWRTDLCVLYHAPEELVLSYADPELMDNDHTLTVLRSSGWKSDTETAEAILRMDPGLYRSGLLGKDPEHAFPLFVKCWQRAVAMSRERGRDLFEKCFGKQQSSVWFPLIGAVHYQETPQEDTMYRLNPCRSYSCVSGKWYEESYEKHRYDLPAFRAVIHEIDRELRDYLGTGRKMKPVTVDPVVTEAIKAVLNEDRKAREQAARPVIRINLSELDQIRKDAIATRNSLLSEEELAELRKEEIRSEDIWKEEKAQEEIRKEEPPEKELSIPLDPVHAEIVQRLLQGKEISGLLKENHILPSIAADTINEALMDELGDTAVFCEADELFLVEDYRQEIEDLFGGVYE